MSDERARPGPRAVYALATCPVGCGELFALRALPSRLPFLYCDACGSGFRNLSDFDYEDPTSLAPHGIEFPSIEEVEAAYPSETVAERTYCLGDFWELVGLTRLAEGDPSAALSIAADVIATWHGPPDRAFDLRARALRAISQAGPFESEQARITETDLSRDRSPSEGVAKMGTKGLWSRLFGADEAPAMRRVRAVGEWTIAVPSDFKTIDNGDSWQAFRGDCVVYVSSMIVFAAKDIDASDGDLVAAGRKLLGRSPPGERAQIAKGGLSGEAVVAPVGEVWRLMGYMVRNGVIATCAIDFPNEADKGWAVTTWQSLEHP